MRLAFFMQNRGEISMPAAPLPTNEIERLVALSRYDILDSLPETEYDDLTLLASQICGVPIALVSLVDSQRQWFKSRQGIDLRESPRELSFCAHAIHDEAIFEVPDATLDARFSDNVLVTGEQHVRFYAGAPLITPDGLALGTLCVIGQQPHALTPSQRAALEALARQVVTLLELRRSLARLEASNRELKASREEFRVFMDNSPIVAFSKDAQGRMIYGNKTWETTFGFPVERVRGLTDFEWLPFETATALRETDQLVLSENRVVQAIEQVPTPDNPRCEWLVFKFPIGEGAERQLGGVALDLTELRRAEKLKDEFIAVVSHELRTPLTALRGSLGLLDNQVAGTLPPHAGEMVKLALKNAERLALLINDLLDMEKIESGAMRFEMDNIDLETLPHNAIELNAAYAAPLGVRLKLEPLPPELRGARVRGDAHRLMQVLSNLLSNGAKFTRLPGGVSLRARLVETPDVPSLDRAAWDVAASDKQGRARVRIEVCDGGNSVPPEFVPRLFERFAQADSTAMRQCGGTGLGLAISRAIIEKHGMRIGYLPPGQSCTGATFFFDLQLAA